MQPLIMPDHVIRSLSRILVRNGYNDSADALAVWHQQVINQTFDAEKQPTRTVVNTTEVRIPDEVNQAIKHIFHLVQPSYGDKCAWDESNMRTGNLGYIAEQVAFLVQSNSAKIDKVNELGRIIDNHHETSKGLQEQIRINKEHTTKMAESLTAIINGKAEEVTRLESEAKNLREQIAELTEKCARMGAWHDGGALDKIAELTKDRDHWKANHDNKVAIKAAVLDRPDLEDRAKKVLAMQMRITELEGIVRDKGQKYAALEEAAMTYARALTAIGNEVGVPPLVFSDLPDQIMVRIKALAVNIEQLGDINDKQGDRIGELENGRPLDERVVLPDNAISMTDQGKEHHYYSAQDVIKALSNAGIGWRYASPTKTPIPLHTITIWPDPSDTQGV